jgi:hypothetical protein
LAYKIFSPEALDIPADFTLSLDISNFYPVMNADGSAPSASLKVKGGTVKAAISAMSLMVQDEASQILEVVLASAIATGGFVDDESLAQDEAFDKFMSSTENGFFDISFSATVQNADGSTVGIDFVLSAPSYLIALETFVELGSRERLNAFAASFMPDDDEGY